MANYSIGLLSNIDVSLRERGENAALWSRGETYSYAQLAEAACSIRELLASYGVKEYSRVGVVTGDDLYTYASLLAIWSLRCAYVPINVHNPPQRNSHVVESAGITVILISEPTKSRRECLGTLENATVIDSQSGSSGSRVLKMPDVTSKDLAYLFFTSGSTGVPKGVPITFGNLDAFMETVSHRMGYAFSPEDRFLQMFEMTFDLSVVSIFAPWSCGGCCYVIPDEGIAYLNIIKVLMEEEITVAVMVPSILGYLQRHFDEISLPSMRLNLFCGEALTHDMVVKWSACIPNSRIENVYGPTEATIWFTSYVWSEQQSEEESVNGIVPIGQPMPGCTTAIVNSDGNPCETGERGELALIGPQVMAGYWKDPKKTSTAFLDVMVGDRMQRAYRSGDIAFVNEREQIIYCGRLDSQVKIDGHRVELGEIEHCARRFLGSPKAAVVLAADPGGQSVLHLFIAAECVDINELQRHLQSEMPAYMCPRHIRLLDDLPVNLNGKIDRKALANMID